MDTSDIRCVLAATSPTSETRPWSEQGRQMAEKRGKEKERKIIRKKNDPSARQVGIRFVRKEYLSMSTFCKGTYSN